MPDFHYEHPRLAEIYDLDSPWSVDRQFYLELAGLPCKKILDLGCGTGLLCNAYAEKNHDVTGVDPAPAMLEVARRKVHGSKIEWVQSLAQTYQSDKLFDLIIMTGHAFQTLLEDRDIQTTLDVMRRHLKTGGTIVFESRNPEVDWANQWNYDIVLDLATGNVRESRRFLAMQHERMTFALHYQFPDETLTSKSELRFLPKRGIEERLNASGLLVDKLFGNWDASPFDERSSHEMIFFARTA